MMKKISISILVITVIVLAITGTVLAQSTSPLTDSGPNGFGRGQGDGLLHEYMVKYMADALGLSVDELNSRLEAGERLSQIAIDLGLNAEEFIQVMSEARLYAMEDAMADGIISQEQYNFMQERANNGAGSFGMGGGHGQGRGGRHMNGGGFNQDCPFNQTQPSN